MLAEIDNFTAEEKKQYYKSLGDMGDYTNIINSAAEEAHAIGKAEGLAKGREEQNLMNAKKLKALGVSV